MRAVVIVLIVLVGGFASIGTGYGSWADDLGAGKMVVTPFVHLAYTNVFTSDDGNPGVCTALLGYDKSEVVLAAENTYPGYQCTTSLEAANKGTLPVRIKLVTLEVVGGTSGTPNLAPIELRPGQLVTLDFAGRDAGDGSRADAALAIELDGFSLCRAVRSGETLRLTLQQEVLPAAPQSAALHFRIRIEAEQWSGVSPEIEAQCHVDEDVD